MNKKVHLVLGSGGARGIAHIGVIEELEKRDYEIVEVIGCSMGAVIGGIYAAGHLDEYRDWLLGLSRSDVFDLMDFTFTRQGFVKGEKIFAKMKEMTGNLKIEDFDIPFTAVATDMKHNREVHFNSGDLYMALRASVSIPGLFTPVVQDDQLLVDGGVLNPLPVNLVQKQEGAIVVAVDLNAPMEEGIKQRQRDRGRRKTKSDIQKWLDKVLPESIKDFAAKHGGKDEEEEEDYSLMGLMETTFNYTQDRLTSLMLEMHPPEVLINIPRNTASTFEFYEAKRVYEMGASRSAKALDSAE